MRAGELLSHIIIYAPDVRRDDFGAQISIYRAAARTRANVIKLRGTIVNSGEELEYRYPLRFICRRYITIPPFSVILYQGSYYMVDSVICLDDRVEVDTHSVDAAALIIDE